jgi:NADH:ubiquinone oxidoreductase subunit E
VTDDERREGEDVAEERPVSEQPEVEDRGVPSIDRPPEGAPSPDRVGSGEPMGAPASQIPDARPLAAEGWDRAADLDADPATIPDSAETPVPDELRAEIERLMALYPDRRSATIPALHAAQALHGWCSPTALRQVATVMQVTPAYLSSVASFYDMLNERPVGRHHVYVCTSVACHLVHAKRVYEALADEAAETGLEDTEVRQFECLGACDMAPMASIDGRYVGPLDPSDAPEIVAAIREGRKPLPGRGLEDSDYRLPWGGRA